ncbi:permease and ATP-binding protein of yersiniabactin-iron ABC transporter YbtQ [Escherichia coli]|uniref:Permease and ATP-binding protein of yersiniabactin-iron ABC transporter YbtQ n=1 Tax=Escherichia coli TaxID=562 RepID=A0A376VI39_ECOLX|nr:permease and ATP-binding protein of yersiniabactin-iron ABC transporter YbtQ [Escherichia coli]
MRWKITDPHSPSGRWRDDADRQRRGVGLQVVVLSGIVWVVTGTLNLAFLIAAVAMIMRFAEPMAMFISYTSVVELIASALQRIEQFMR